METKGNDTQPWATWIEELGKEGREIAESDPDDTEDSWLTVVNECDTESEKEADGSEETDFDASQFRFEGRDGTIWTSTPNQLDSKPPENSIDQPRAKGKGENAQTFLDSFSCIIDDKIIRLITSYTNLKIAFSKLNFKHQSEASSYTTEVEISALLGLIFLIGLKCPGRRNIQDLWDQHGVGMEVFYLTMSYKRYIFLLGHLCFKDLMDFSLSKGLDRMTPIKEVLDMFRQNCQSSLSPGEQLTIDDMLVEYKGSCPFRQYIPKKKSRGIRLFLLVDTKTMYTHNIEISVPKYLGRPHYAVNEPCNIAKRLVLPICGAYRNVTLDSWFTDVNLALDLLKNHQITCIGSISKKKKELPNEFIKKIRQDQGSLIGFLKDERCFLMSYQEMGKINIYLSTRHEEASIDKLDQVIKLYQDTKQAVNELYRMCNVYNVARTCNMWPLAIFYQLLNIAGINGITIYKANHPEEKITRPEYLKGLALELIKPHITERIQKDNIHKNLKRKMNYFLSLEDDKVTPAKRVANHPGRCYLCSKKKRDRKTTTTCKTCHKFICMGHHVIVCAKCVRTQGGSSKEGLNSNVNCNLDKPNLDKL